MNKSKERIRLLADNMAQLAWMADGKGVVDWYNKRWFDYTGTTWNEMQQDGWRAVLHPEHAARVMEKMSRCFEQEENWEDTFPLRGVDGRYRWFLSRALPVRDERQRVVVWIGTHTDVTVKLEAEAEERARSAELERQLAEHSARLGEKSRQLEQAAAELQVNQMHLQGILENSPASIYMQDLNGCFISVNHRAAETFGLPPAELIGKTLFDFLPADEASKTRQEDFRILAEGVPSQVERVRPIPGGGMHADLVTRFPVRQDDGKVYALGSIVTDITELKHVEQELQAARSFLHAILDSANYAIISTNEHGIIRTFNPAAERLLGYKADELIGKATPALFHHPHEVKQQGRWLEQTYGESLETGFDVLFAIARRKRLDERKRYFQRKDGTEVSVLLSITALCDAQGEISGYLGIASDITERIKAEAAIVNLNRALERRAGELEATNNELESFSYSVSHDLRAPLRSIDVFSRVLLEDYTELLDNEGRDLLGRVRAAAQRMAQLIDDILTLSRLSRTEMRLETVDLSAIAHSVANELRALEPQRHVDFVIEDSVSGHGDRRLLRVVLENLLGNAWKYTSRHHRGCIEFGTEQRADGVQVYYVRDDGSGFDMAYVGKLFGTFQRLHTEAEFPGTGVGLSIVQRIVHRHGGEVWAEGQPEAGATFRFILGEQTGTP